MRLLLAGRARWCSQGAGGCAACAPCGTSIPVAAHHKLRRTHGAQEHQKLHEVLLVEESKRKALLDIIYALEVGGLAIWGLGPPWCAACLPLHAVCLWVLTCAAHHAWAQNDKRQLETAMVVEGGAHHAQKRGVLNGGNAEAESGACWCLRVNLGCIVALASRLVPRPALTCAWLRGAQRATSG